MKLLHLSGHGTQGIFDDHRSSRIVKKHPAGLPSHEIGSVFESLALIWVLDENVKPIVLPDSSYVRQMVHLILSDIGGLLDGLAATPPLFMPPLLTVPCLLLLCLVLVIDLAATHELSGTQERESGRDASSLCRPCGLAIFELCRHRNCPLFISTGIDRRKYPRGNAERRMRSTFVGGGRWSHRGPALVVERYQAPRPHNAVVWTTA